MGPESAELELKWMREELRARRAAVTPATSSPPRRRKDLEWELEELGKMVDRRMKDEPLQYILGGYGSNTSSGLVPVASFNRVDCCTTIAHVDPSSQPPLSIAGVMY